MLVEAMLVAAVMAARAAREGDKKDGGSEGRRSGGGRPVYISPSIHVDNRHVDPPSNSDDQDNGSGPDYDGGDYGDCGGDFGGMF